MRFSPAEVVTWAGDQVHWFNETGELHEPGVIRNDGTFVAFLEEPVAAGAASSVFSSLPRLNKENKQIAFTIHYVCGRHRNEQGAIQVIPAP
jgi:plastocyanin